MAKLGEAYVRVRADLEPFAKDLDKGLKQITDRFEATLNRRLGQRLGRDVGTGIRDGVRESSRDIDRDLNRLSIPANNRRRGRRAGQDFGDGYGEGLFGTIKRFSGLFVTALEDGFSSLPPQVKGIVGAAIVAAIIPAGAFLSAALGAAILAGTAGIGVALASQFTEVQGKWETFVERLRVRAVSAAERFAGETVASLDLFDQKLEELDPKIRNLFGNASRYVEPFARGITGAIDGLVSGLDRGLANSDFEQLSASIETGLTRVGTALGDAFDTILSNPDLDVALSDLLETVGDLVDMGAAFLDWTVTAYNDLKRVGEVVGEVVQNFANFADLLATLTSGPDDDWARDIDKSWTDLVDGFTGGGADQVRVAITRIDEAGREWNNTTSATITATEKQAKALKEMNALIERQLRLVNDVIGTQIDYQAAIDQTTEDLKEYGRTLDLGDEKGRRNAENVQTEINALREQVEAQVQAGKITNAEGEKFFQAEIARIRARFNGNKALLTQFDQLFGALIKLSEAPVVPNKLGPFASALGGIISALDKIIARQKAIGSNNVNLQPSARNTSGVGPGQQKYADGGFITEPTNAIMGENYREEVVLPLTNTRRSMQLLSRSPLAGLLGGSTNVSVYIGNEQLATRQYEVATGVNRAAARTLSQAPRLV